MAHERDKQTEQPCYSMCSNMPLSLAISAIRPNNENKNINE